MNESIGDIFKRLVWDTLVSVMLKQLFSAVPWLGWGPVGLLVGWIVGMVADYLYVALEMAVDLQVIKFKNEAHRREFEKASVTLHILAKEKGIDSPEFKSARDEHKKALSLLVQFNLSPV